MGDIDPTANDLHRDTIVIDGLIISKWDRQIFEDMQPVSYTHLRAHET